MDKFRPKLQRAIRHFWATRDKQAAAQGSRSGVRDAGLRTAVTGGKHLDGFVQLLCDILADANVPKACVYCEKQLEIPGFFRATKRWDVIVLSDSKLIATVEFKAIVGSFGNNMNNRAEESVGNATDLLAAYREGAFKPSLRPWLGYLLLIEDRPGSKGSRNPVKVKEPHFSVLPEFQRTSYLQRGEILLEKLVRESLYDAACLLASPSSGGPGGGEYTEPSEELSFRNFAESLLARAIAHCRINPPGR